MANFSPAPFNLQNGVTADASQVDANINQIIAEGNANVASNGINSDITQLTGLTTPLSNGQGGTNIFTGGASTGTANAQIIDNLIPANFSLVEGNIITFIAGNTNTGAMQINVNSTGLKNLYDQTLSGPAALLGNEVISGQLVMVGWDGTQYQLLSKALGSLVSQNANAVNITGGSITGITDIAVADGGTGASTAAGARTNLGVNQGVIQLADFTTPGAFTFTTSANITTATKFKFILTGAGAGGAGVAAGNIGAGGGSAATAILSVSGLAPSTGYSGVIGAAGTGGSSGANNGTAGGDTTLTINATTVTAGGGQGGVTAGAGGAPGAATNGTINIPGTIGGNGFAANVGAVPGGQGGGSFWGGGGPGGRQANGGNGGGYGTGGGGAQNDGGSNRSGGNGVAGIVTAEWIE